jgi:hypothetical protein
VKRWAGTALFGTRRFRGSAAGVRPFPPFESARRTNPSTRRSLLARGLRQTREMLSLFPDSPHETPKPRSGLRGNPLPGAHAVELQRRQAAAPLPRGRKRAAPSADPYNTNGPPAGPAARTPWINTMIQRPAAPRNQGPNGPIEPPALRPRSGAESPASTACPARPCRASGPRTRRRARACAP